MQPLILVVVVVVAFLAFVFVALPPMLVTADDIPSGPKRIDAQNSVRTAAAQLLGVIGLAIGAVFTARTFQLNKQGQITERFSRAIDQLGKDQLDVRLGGIYALERIARDSDNDHAQIMEVLTAYLRHHSRGTDGHRRYPASLA
jgi:hypothetical protein